MDEQNMQDIADSIWEYILEKHLKPYLSDSVCYYVATVTTAANNGTIGVTRPFDNQVFIPCSTSASTLSVGSPCTVLVFGGYENQMAIGNARNL